MAAIDLADGPVWLLIERDAGQAQVHRLHEAPWVLTERLMAGVSLQAAIEASLASVADTGVSPATVQAALADHLAAGRFIALARENSVPCDSEHLCFAHARPPDARRFSPASIA